MTDMQSVLIAVIVVVVVVAALYGWLRQRRNRQLRADGWIGWEELPERPALLRRLDRNPRLAMERLHDRPPKSAGEARAALGIFQRLDPEGRGFAPALQPPAYPEAERRLIDRILDPQVFRNSDGKYLERRLSRISATRPDWAEAARWTLHRCGWTVEIADPVSSCSVAWEELAGEILLHALDRTLETKSPSQPLLEKIIVRYLHEQEAGRTPPGPLGERLQRAAKLLSGTAPASIHLSPETATAIGEALDRGAAEADRPTWAVLSLLLARHVANRVLRANAHGNPLPDAKRYPLLLEQKPCWPQLPELEQAACLLAAASREPETGDLVLEAARKWPQLAGLESFVLDENAPGDPGLRRQALLGRWRHRATAERAVGLANRALDRGEDVPVEAILHPAAFAHTAEPRRRLAWLEWLARRVAGELPGADPLPPARLVELAERLAGLCGKPSEVPADVVSGLLALCEALLRHPYDELAVRRRIADELDAVVAHLAQSAAAVFAERLEQVALDAFRYGARDRRWLAWLTLRLADRATEVREKDTQAGWRALFHAAFAVGESWGARGLVRLPEAPDDGVELAHLVAAWAAGERSEAILQRFADLAPADPRLPFAAVEVELATAVYEAGRAGSAEFEKRLVRALWKGGSLPQEKEAELLRQLLERHANDTPLLAAFLARSPYAAADEPLALEAISQLSRRGHASIDHNRRLVRAIEEGRHPVVAFPFEALTDERARGSAANRLEDLLAAARLLGVEAVRDHPVLAARAALLTEQVRLEDRTAWQRLLAGKELAELLLACVSEDDSEAFATLVQALCADGWRPVARPTLERALAADRLQADEIVFLGRGLWRREHDAAATLRAIRRLCDRGERLEVAAELLAEVVEGGTEMGSLEWVDLPLLARFEQHGHRHGVLRAELAARLFREPGVEPPVARRLAAQLVRDGVELPAAALCRALEVAGEASHAELLARALLRRDDLGDEAPEALAAVLDRRELGDGRCHGQVLRVLDRAGRLPPDSAPDLVRLAVAQSRTSDLEGDPTARYQDPLLAMTSWPDDLTVAVEWYVRQAVRAGAAPARSLVERLERESGGRFELPSERPADRSDAARLAEIERRVAAGESVSLNELLQLTAHALGERSAHEVAALVRELCTRLAAAEAADRCSPATLALLLDLHRRDALPAAERPLLVEILLEAGRIDSLAYLGIETLLEPRRIGLLRRVFRSLHKHRRHRRLAGELLRELVHEEEEQDFASELILACEAQLATGDLETEDLAQLLERSLLVTEEVGREEFEHGVGILLRWPGELANELALLLRAVDRGAVPATTVAWEHLHLHARDLEHRGSEVSAGQALRLRRHLRAICGDPVVERLNDLALLRQHDDVPDAARLLRLLRVEPGASAVADLTHDRNLVGAALAALPEGSPWTGVELDLAELLVREAGVRKEVLSRPTPSLAQLVERILEPGPQAGGRSRLEAIDTLIEVLRRQSGHPQAERWFESLLERLAQAQYEWSEPVAQRTGQLLGDGVLAPPFALRLLRFGLDSAGCPPAPLLATARRLGRLGRDDARALLLCCLQAGERSQAFAILEQFARATAVEGVGASPGFALDLEDEPWTPADFEELLERYLKGDRDPRALLWSLEVHVRRDRLDRAALTACEIRDLLAASEVRRPTEAPVEPGGRWSEELERRYREALTRLARTTGMDSYRRMGLQPGLLAAVSAWLDLDKNPVEPVDRESIERIAWAVEAFQEADDGSDQLDGEVRSLLERGYAVSWKAIVLLEEWVPERPEALRVAGSRATLHDWILLARLLARNGHPIRAQKRFESVLAQILRQPPRPESEAAYEAVTECAIDILRGSLRESRGATLSWVAKIEGGTLGFIRPGPDTLTLDCRIAYTRLKSWCCLAGVCDALSSQEPRDTTHASRWMVEIQSDSEASAHAYPKLVAEAQEALREGELKPLIKCLRERKGLEGFVSWAEGAPAEPEPSIEELVDGRYEVLDTLSDEGLYRRARLQRVRDMKSPDGSNPVVALKRLPDLDDQVSEHLEKMRREATELARIEHAGLVQLLDRHLDARPYYLVTEYVPGTSLDQWLDRVPRPAIHERLRIFWDLLDVIRVLHENHCVHRNLHPRNVLVVPAGERPSRVVVTDMSSIKPLDVTPGAQTTLLDGATVYMAPELRRGSQYRLTSAADLFSLGRIMALVFTRRLNPDHEDWPPELSQLAPIYTHATDPDPRQRFGGTDTGGEEGAARGIREMRERFRPVLEDFRRYVLPRDLGRPTLLAELEKCAGDLVWLRKAPGRVLLRGRLTNGHREQVAIKVVARRSDLGRQLGSRLERIEPLRQGLQGIAGAVQIPRGPHEDAQNIYLFSEFVPPGASLGDVYTVERRQIAPGILVDWLLQTLETLAECHRREIYHRYLKPSNILLDDDGRAHLSDFVLSRIQLGPGHRTTHLDRRDAFVAPELKRAVRAPQEGADLYSLVMSFSVGLTAHPGEPAPDRHRHQLALVGHGSGLGPLTELLNRQLAENPAKRPAQRADELRERLAAVCERYPPEPADPIPLIREAARIIEPRPVQPDDLL